MEENAHSRGRVSFLELHNFNVHGTVLMENIGAFS